MKIYLVRWRDGSFLEETEGCPVIFTTLVAAKKYAAMHFEHDNRFREVRPKVCEAELALLLKKRAALNVQER